MASIRAFLIRKLLLPKVRESMDFSSHTVEEIRKPAASLPLPAGTVVEKAGIDGFKAEWVAAPNVPAQADRSILYIHGGGFVMGSCDTHRGVAARISEAAGVRVLLIEYRLAPEYPFPAANEDCLAAYRWLLAAGVAPGEIIIGGDSAGGGLVLMTLLALREAGDPLPAGAFLISPFAEYIRLDGESYGSKALLDPVCDRKGSEISAGHFIGDLSPIPDVLRPLDQDLSGLPPMLIQVGDREVLQSDSIHLAERAGAAGNEAVLEIWPGMWHVFQLFTPFLPEANRAVKRIGEFVREKLA